MPPPPPLPNKGFEEDFFAAPDDPPGIDMEPRVPFIDRSCLTAGRCGEGAGAEPSSLSWFCNAFCRLKNNECSAWELDHKRSKAITYLV